MGHSITIHCIGVTKENEKGERRLYNAMNKTEIEQARHEAKKERLEIDYWYAQTKTGVKLLGVDYIAPFLKVQDSEVSHSKVITCSICKGEGKRKREDGFYNGCPVCNNTGITRKGNEKHWQEWQLENIKAEFN